MACGDFADCFFACQACCRRSPRGSHTGARSRGYTPTLEITSYSLCKNGALLHLFFWHTQGASRRRVLPVAHRPCEPLTSRPHPRHPSPLHHPRHRRRRRRPRVLLRTPRRRPRPRARSQACPDPAPSCGTKRNSQAIARALATPWRLWCRTARGNGPVAEVALDALLVGHEGAHDRVVVVACIVRAQPAPTERWSTKSSLPSQVKLLGSEGGVSQTRGTLWCSPWRCTA